MVHPLSSCNKQNTHFYQPSKTTLKVYHIQYNTWVLLSYSSHQSFFHFPHLKHIEYRASSTCSQSWNPSLHLISHHLLEGSGPDGSRVRTESLLPVAHHSGSVGSVRRSSRWPLVGCVLVTETSPLTVGWAGQSVLHPTSD